MPGGGVNGKGNKVDKVYTVGCFDLFHRGHINLLRNMRKLGREVCLCECVCVCVCVCECVSV